MVANRLVSSLRKAFEALPTAPVAGHVYLYSIWLYQSIVHSAHYLSSVEVTQCWVRASVDVAGGDRDNAGPGPSCGPHLALRTWAVLLHDGVRVRVGGGLAHGAGS